MNSPLQLPLITVSEPTSEEEHICVCMTTVILGEGTTSADLCTITLWHMQNWLM